VTHQSGMEIDGVHTPKLKEQALESKTAEDRMV
jgi:hypothetical protein